MKLLFVALFMASVSLAFASNPQDEQVVRTAYAKLAYASQSRTVAREAQRNPDLTAAELNKKIEDNELRFEITALASGSISEIESRPYSEFVTKPDQQQVLFVGQANYSVTEFGKLLAVSLFANPHWTKADSQSNEDWNMPIKQALVYSGNAGKYSRYVTATITVSFQGRSRTYHTLWWFSDSDVMSIDPVIGNSVRDFVKESVFPSVLTDTHLRTFAVVNDWLTSTQRFETSCKAGKVDVCCDSAMHCGVLAEDLRNTKPTLNPMTEGKIQ